MIIVLYALTALLYGTLAASAWRSRLRFAEVPGDVLGIAPQSLSPRDRALLGAALVSHGLLLELTIFPEGEMVYGFAFALSAMLWLGVLIYWIESLFFPLDGLRMLALPVAFVASLLPLMFGGVKVLPYSADLLFKLHFLVANVAYGLLALAAAHAALMLLVERRLHAARSARVSLARPDSRAALRAATRDPSDDHWASNWLDALPPLLTLEKLLFRLIWAGFIVLTLALGSGILFSEQLFHKPLRFDHKTIFAVMSWVMFGGVLAGRTFYGWRGRTALRWVLASFVSLLLAYVGSRFVLEVLLHRAVV
ncbi:cytochrome C assembly family protein [Pararobbsia silviterrae]|uniref:Inner membrane protein YpjD n=1 Tax=Pararobbsia silviterrae TaxID=1792498 RepID=A0A494XFT4_9BURK|nr:cytochrome c biogenesis protein CcsA [Pararobbsia silviterrae]RKP48541.1 inner membrane protein YpjD [Pararobbsia silviterrae]